MQEPQKYIQQQKYVRLLTKAKSIDNHTYFNINMPKGICDHLDLSLGDKMKVYLQNSKIVVERLDI